MLCNCCCGWWWLWLWWNACWYCASRVSTANISGRQVCCELLPTNSRVWIRSFGIYERCGFSTCRLLSWMDVSEAVKQTDSLSHQIQSNFWDWDLNQDPAVKTDSAPSDKLFLIIIFFLVVPVLDRQVKWILWPPTQSRQLPLQILLTCTETIFIGIIYRMCQDKYHISDERKWSETLKLYA